MWNSSREDNDLVLFGYNGDDSVRLLDYMSSSSWNDSVFQFADKTVTTADLMKNGLVLQGSDSNESIYGWSYRNEIYGAAGNDTIVTYGADDVLDGGAGNDTLDGGAGNDYVNWGAWAMMVFTAVPATIRLSAVLAMIIL